MRLTSEDLEPTDCPSYVAFGAIKKNNYSHISQQETSDPWCDLSGF